jgi:hypothetical protein
MLTKFIVAAVGLACAQASQAQAVRWTQRMHALSPYSNGEIALAVNRVGSDVMLAWMHYYVNPFTGQPDYDIWHNVSTNGDTFGPGARLPRTTER